MASAALNAPTSHAAAIGMLERRMVELTQKNAVPVPTYPAVAVRLRTLLKAPDYKVADLVTLVSGDQAIAAQLLQIANSAAHARKGPATSLRAAHRRQTRRLYLRAHAFCR